MDLIDRDHLLDLIGDENIEAHMDSVMDGELHRVKRAFQRIIFTMPSAEKTGKWIEGDMSGLLQCSSCGEFLDEFGHRWNYCPNCGARMIETNG